jgi:hypothetical protein
LVSPLEHAREGREVNESRKTEKTGPSGVKTHKYTAILLIYEEKGLADCNAT